MLQFTTTVITIHNSTTVNIICAIMSGSMILRQQVGPGNTTTVMVSNHVSTGPIAPTHFPINELAALSSFEVYGKGNPSRSMIRQTRSNKDWVMMDEEDSAVKVGSFRGFI